MKGLFITFEGPDGSGKTTQLKRLGERLKAEGFDVVMTREPGGTAISDRIRSILLNPEHQEMADRTEVLLYAASRAQHVHEVILPALSRGAVVLCDRYIDASIAYQAYGLGQDAGQVASISEYASNGLWPRRTYLLDVPVEVSRERLKARANAAGGSELDRIEQKEMAYHRRVREAFLQIAETNAHRVLLINAARPEDEIANEIREDCARLLKEE